MLKVVQRVRPGGEEYSQKFRTFINLAVPSKYVGNYNIQLTQYSGSFSIEYAMQAGTIFQNDEEITVGTFAGNSFQGVVEAFDRGISRQGLTYTISGTLRPAALNYNVNLSLASADPFVRPNGQLIPTPPVPADIQNYYQLFGMDSTQAYRIIAQATGAAVETIGSLDNYPIWRHVISNTTIPQALQGIAQLAGGQVVLRWDGAQGRYVIKPWGQPIRNFTYEFRQTLDGVRKRTEITEFTDVVITPSSDITPWNSTYAGVPQQVAQVQFKAGPTNEIDNSMGMGLYQNSGWFFPQFAGNRWIRFITDPFDFSSKIYNNFGVYRMWAVQPATERNFTFSTSNTRDLSIAERNSNEVTELQPYNTVNQDYDVLFSWTRAVKKIESQGDIFPELYVLPSNKAPRYTQDFNTNSQNVFNCSLLGYRLINSSLANSTGPSSHKTLTPLGYGIPVFSDPFCTQPGFAPDGSFFIGLQPNSDNYTIYPNSYKGGQPEPGEIYTKEMPGYTIDFYSNPTASLEPGSVVNDTSSTVTQKYAVVHWKKSEPESDELKAERQQKMKELENIFRGRNPDGSAIPEDARILWDMVATSFDTSSFRGRIFHFLVYARFVNDTTMTVMIDNLPPQDKLNQPLILKKAKVSGIGDVPIGPVIPTAQNSDNSGTVDQAVQPLEGNWTLYALHRRTYPPTAICPVGQESVFYSYSGQYPYQPENPKTISSGLITDFMNEDNSHIGRLAKRISAYLGQEFISFNIRIPNLGQEIPMPGDSVTVTNIPLVGATTAIGEVISTTLSGDRGGHFVDVQCGRLEFI